MQNINEQIGCMYGVKNICNMHECMQCSSVLPCFNSCDLASCLTNLHSTCIYHSRVCIQMPTREGPLLERGYCGSWAIRQLPSHTTKNTYTPIIMAANAHTYTTHVKHLTAVAPVYAQRCCNTIDRTRTTRISPYSPLQGHLS